LLDYVGFDWDFAIPKLDLLAEARFYPTKDAAGDPGGTPTSQQLQGFQALLKNDRVIDAALKDSSVAKLPFIEKLWGPQKWVYRSLSSEYLDNGDLRITMVVPAEDSNQGIMLLNAVVRALASEAEKSSPGSVSVQKSFARARDGWH
jgi:hypothetical protein